MICDALKGKCCILGWRAELCTWPENMKYGAQARVRSAECRVHFHYNLAFYSTSSSSVSSADYNWPESADLLSFCTQESTTCVQIRQRLLCTCFALRSCRTLHSVLDCVKTSRFATAMASISTSSLLFNVFERSWSPRADHGATSFLAICWRAGECAENAADLPGPARQPRLRAPHLFMVQSEAIITNNNLRSRVSSQLPASGCWLLHLHSAHSAPAHAPVTRTA